MKRIALILCLALLICCLASCELIFGTGNGGTGNGQGSGTNPPSGNQKPPHTHSFVEGRCECGAVDPTYTAPHTHSFVEGKCQCGATDPTYTPPHTHSFVEGKCQCGATDPTYTPPHTHSFVEGKCQCGATDPTYTPPHTHSFVEGKCECGETDPDYVPEEPGKEALPSDTISLNGLRGLNEQILVRISYTEGFTYRVYYKNDEDADFTLLDENLMIWSEDEITCYILGIKKGNYQVKIEAENDIGIATVTYEEIAVAAQDRSGYAHFNNTEGVGAYNDDGTVKENAKIIYVTNENKNTVTLVIDGTEYVGLVNILQAQYKSDTPLLIRIIGKITTNQWNYKNVEPRLADGSNASDDFFVNTFSNEYGENLANLIVKMKFNGAGAKTYNYRTTPDGLTEVRLTNAGTSTTTYKGSDFSSLKGKTVFDDDSYYNMLEVKASSNITIEGIGKDAEIFQFGISFEECNNIEIKNLTFTGYPEDALNFLGGDREELGNYSRYWIHNCTFNRGYNAWDITGERDKYAGDGSIDFNNVSGLTLAYNVFDNTKKSMLFGSGDSCACMNMTMHHNYFNKVESRLPLGRNSNIHSYNNYFSGCKNASSLRVGTYMFSENNYYDAVSKPFDLSSSVVKSYGDIFVNSNKGSITVVTSRDQAVTASCKPDKTTNYSGFDTNSSLFYYNEETGASDVAYLISADEVPSFVLKYAGAGVINQLPTE